eukprot:15613421-Heterocapsa_arctica.AAC.1
MARWAGTQRSKQDGGRERNGGRDTEAIASRGRQPLPAAGCHPGCCAQAAEEGRRGVVTPPPSCLAAAPSVVPPNG